MSWYDYVDGEIVTSPEARAIVEEEFQDWMEPETEGGIYIEDEFNRLRVQFGGFYRNLRSHLYRSIVNILNAFPEETEGELWLCSTDGGFHAAAYRIAEGRLFRRILAEAPEREIRVSAVHKREVVS